jgi:hypothetical protein
MTKRPNLMTPSLTVAARALRRLELDGEGDCSRLGFRWRLWRRGLLFMRLVDVRNKAREGVGAAPVTGHRVRLGHELEDEDDGG